MTKLAERKPCLKRKYEVFKKLAALVKNGLKTLMLV